MRINSVNTYNFGRGQKLPAKNTKNQSSPAFKGMLPGAAVNKCANSYRLLAENEGFRSFISKFGRLDNTFTPLIIMESIILSGFYMINTLTNKKIKKEQKPQMLVNDAMTLGVSTAGALFLEDKLSAGVNKFAENYFVKHKDFYTQLGKKALSKEGNNFEMLLKKASEVAENNIDDIKVGAEEAAELFASHVKNIAGESKDKLKTFQVVPEEISKVTDAVKNAVINNKGNAEKTVEAVKKAAGDLYEASAARAEADSIKVGINKLKVIVIFGLIYRYFGPVLITPLANKISSKFFDNKGKTEKADKTDKTDAKKSA